MIKISLVCATGLSSNMLVDTLKRKADEKKIDCTIKSFAAMDFTAAIEACDVLVLGPQYGYKLEEVEAKAAGKCQIVTLKEYEYGPLEAGNILDKVVAAVKL